MTQLAQQQNAGIPIQPSELLNWDAAPAVAASEHVAAVYLRKLFKHGDLVCIQLIHATDTYVIFPMKDGEYYESQDGVNYSRYDKTLTVVKDGGKFYANEIKSENEVRPPKATTKTMFKPLEEVVSKPFLKFIETRNQKGWNIYVAMNQMKAEAVKRNKNFIGEIRSVYADADDNGDASLAKIRTDAASGRIPHPSVVLGTSPNKYQFVWFADGMNQQTQEAINVALARVYKTDEATTDCSRVLRIPGFKNMKPKYDPKPVVKILEMSDARYTAGDFHIELDVKEETKVGDAIPPRAIAGICGVIEKILDASGTGIKGQAKTTGDYVYQYTIDCPNERHAEAGTSHTRTIDVRLDGLVASTCWGSACDKEGDERKGWLWLRKQLDPFDTYRFARPDGKAAQMTLEAVLDILTTDVSAPSADETLDVLRQAQAPQAEVPKAEIPTETPTAPAAAAAAPAAAAAAAAAAAPAPAATASKRKTAEEKRNERIEMRVEIDSLTDDEKIAVGLFSRTGNDDFDSRLAASLDDSGQAARFVKQFRQLFLRETEYWENWIRFNGQRWEVDTRQRHVRAMKESVDGFRKSIEKAYKIAKKYADTTEAKETLGKRRETLLGYCDGGLSAKRINSAIAMTAGTEIYVGHEQFDQQPWLLNVSNGTIDLKNGVLREHRADDYLTQMTKVKYDADATCPRFLKFLAEITNNDEETIKYIRRIFGYCLTGDISEQAFFLFFGVPGSGKSTLLKILLWLLGDYAKVPVPGMFVDSKHVASPQAAQPGMVHLVGARAVISHELEEKTTLNAPLLNTLTGDGVVPTRGLYGTTFDFEWQAKVIFTTNYLPDSKDYSGATSDRKKIVEFKTKFRGTEAQVKDLDKKIFAAEASGIFTWALGGLHDPQDGYFALGGLKEPQSVKDRVAEDEASRNDVLQWLTDEYEIGSDFETVQDEAVRSFNQYVGDPKKHKDKKELTARLKMLALRGFDVVRRRADDGHQIRVYRGFQLITPTAPV